MRGKRVKVIIQQAIYLSASCLTQQNSRTATAKSPKHHPYHLQKLGLREFSLVKTHELVVIYPVILGLILSLSMSNSCFHSASFSSFSRWIVSNSNSVCTFFSYRILLSLSSFISLDKFLFLFISAWTIIFSFAFFIFYPQAILSFLLFLYSPKVIFPFTFFHFSPYAIFPPFVPSSFLPWRA